MRVAQSWQPVHDVRSVDRRLLKAPRARRTTRRDAAIRRCSSDTCHGKVSGQTVVCRAGSWMADLKLEDCSRGALTMHCPGCGGCCCVCDWPCCSCESVGDIGSSLQFLSASAAQFVFESAMTVIRTASCLQGEWGRVGLSDQKDELQRGAWVEPSARGAVRCTEYPYAYGPVGASCRSKNNVRSLSN